MSNRENHKVALSKALRSVPLVICIVLVVFAIIYRDRLSVENILALAPDSPVVTSFVLVGLYAVKSLSVVFPMLVLNVAAGVLLSPAAALVVNLIGVTVMSALPYFVGYFSGKEHYEKLKIKYPSVAKEMESRRDSVLFYSFFLRIISCLPGDVVSMFFGFTKAAFPQYLIGSVLGILPGTVLATFMGVGIANPKEPTFILSLAINVALSGLSIVLHMISEKRKKNR